MLGKIVQPALAFAMRDFFVTIRNPRFLALSIILGAFLIGSGSLIASTTVGLPPPGSLNSPNPFEVWFKGSNGALTGLAFGVSPIVLPFLPILMAIRSLQNDRDQGIFQLSLTKPIPPWGPALGKFAGMYGALAIPTAVMTAGSAVAIQVIAGTPLSGGLVAAYVAGSLLLVGLYLLLTLLVGTLVPHDLVLLLVLPAWVGFNAIRQTGFVITARLATILGAREATTFQPSWLDLSTFTGLHEGFVAPSVPSDLGFVIPMDPSASGDPIRIAVPVLILVWFVVLFVAYAIALQRIAPRQSGRRA